MVAPTRFVVDFYVSPVGEDIILPFVLYQFNGRGKPLPFRFYSLIIQTL